MKLTVEEQELVRSLGYRFGTSLLGLKAYRDASGVARVLATYVWYPDMLARANVNNCRVFLGRTFEGLWYPMLYGPARMSAQCPKFPNVTEALTWLELVRDR